MAEKELSLQEVLQNISENKLNAAEEFFIKKFGKEKGLEFIKFLSDGKAQFEDYRINFQKILNEEETASISQNLKTEEFYSAKLYNKDLSGLLKFNIFVADPKYIRMAFSETREKDESKTLDIMLKIIDEIAMKIDAKLVQAPYPAKNEQSVYRQHKYEPFTDHPVDKTDYTYDKYDIKHCKSNILGLNELLNHNKEEDREI